MPWEQGPGIARQPQEMLSAPQLWPHSPALRCSYSCSQQDLAREGLRAWMCPLTSLAEEVKMHFANPLYRSRTPFGSWGSEHPSTCTQNYSARLGPFLWPQFGSYPQPPDTPGCPSPLLLPARKACKCRNPCPSRPHRGTSIVLMLLNKVIFGGLASW